MPSKREPSLKGQLPEEAVEAAARTLDRAYDRHEMTLESVATDAIEAFLSALTTEQLRVLAAERMGDEERGNLVVRICERLFWAQHAAEWEARGKPKKWQDDADYFLVDAEEILAALLPGEPE